MNSAQRKVLMVGLPAIIFMGLFPSWMATQHPLRGFPKREQNWGYSFFFKQPKAVANLERYCDLFNISAVETDEEWSVVKGLANLLSFQINYAHLGLQWAFVVLMAGGLILLTRPGRKRE